MAAMGDVGPSFDETLPGVEVAKVLSDSSHFTPFICSLCEGLVSLNATVTSRCSHPFCAGCFEKWACTSSSCPKCEKDLSPEPSLGCMVVVGNTVSARPLHEAQPLAFRVLQAIRIQCCREGSAGCGKNGCRWSGEYGNWHHHIQDHQVDDESDMLVASSASTSSAERSVRKDELEKESTYPLERRSPGSQRKDEKPCTPKRLNSSLQDLARAQQALNDSPSSPATNTEQRSTSGESMAKISPKLPRWKSNSYIQASPLTKEQVPRSTTRDAPPMRISRKASGAISFAGSSKASSSLYEEDSSESAALPLSPYQRSVLSSSQSTLDWHASINTASLWDESEMGSDAMTIPDGAVTDDDSDDETMLALHLDPEDEETVTSPEVKSKQILERAEKLKKQANAKFNKGDFVGARELYTEGITVMSAFTPVSPGERSLLSNMHSNRAVTYFRDKDFKSCIDDCNKAIEHDPTFDKSWVRKWRALVSIGQFDEAHLFIEDAARLLPDSKRIQDEYSRSHVDHMAMSDASELMKANKLDEACNVLQSLAGESTNLSLICMTADLDIALGRLDSALELALHALRLNPKYARAMELKGLSVFLMGDTEQGAHVLYDAYCLDGDCPRIKESLTRCQKIHSAASQARSAIKRGRYEDASVSFTTSIEESEPMSTESPLSSMLLAERAEAWLLSSNYREALKDCQQILDMNVEHPGAWVIRSEVLISLGKAKDAEMELAEVRKGWGADDPAIEEGYRRVDFELRVERADEDLSRFLSELESGTSNRCHYTTIQNPRKRTDGRPTDERSFGAESRESTHISSFDYSNGDDHSPQSYRKSPNSDLQNSTYFDDGTKGARRRRHERTRSGSTHKSTSKSRSSTDRAPRKDYARERRSRSSRKGERV